jgi:hypothetical protein
MLSVRLAPTAVAKTAACGVATTRSSVPAGAAEPEYPGAEVPPPAVEAGLPVAVTVVPWLLL